MVIGPDEFDKAIKSASAGKTVYEENLARAEQAGTQTPFPSHLKSEPGEPVQESNADKENLLDPLADSVVDKGGAAGKSLLDGPDDDAFVETSATNKSSIQFEEAFDQAFDPSPNPTTEYAQLTYNIGLYLATPEQYIQMMGQQTKSVQGFAKILQSGGNNISDDVLFPDLFIDDLEIESLMPEANKAAHNVLQMSFKIIEPMGYTFLTKLKNLCARLGLPDYVKQHYIMVIKYRGYDENGKQVSDEQDDRLTKIVPFLISKIYSSVNTGAVEYDCRAVAITHDIGLSAKRATIPFNVEMLGQTMEEIFNATESNVERRNTESEARPPVYNYPPAFGGKKEAQQVTPGILKNSAGSVVASKGILVELNKQQKELVKKGAQEVADQYKVTFKNGIGTQKVTASVAGKTDKSKVALDKTSTKSANSLLNNTSMDKSRQLFSIPAGQQIPQLLDILLRASDYTIKQQKIIVEKDGKTVKGTTNNKPLQWWHIGVNISPIAWDNKRNDYGYEIEYVVSPKKINDTYSPYFNKAQFKGVHKSYNYWFTGENTEILSYSQELNATYFTPIDGKVPVQKKDQSPEKQNSKTSAYVNQDAAGLAQAGSIASPAEQAAEVIYSTVDFATFEMEIFGDPDYLQQNDVFFDSGNVLGPYMPDGSINYDSQEVLIGLNFRTMEDYDANTGGAQLLDPMFTDGTNTTQGLIYKLTHVTSLFKEGKMTQTMRGLLREFDAPQQVDSGREPKVEEAPGSGPAKSRPGNEIPGDRAITGQTEKIAPNFGAISVAGNQVPGSRAETYDEPIAPVYNGRRGNNVPGQRAVTPRDTIGPKL